MKKPKKRKLIQAALSFEDWDYGFNLRVEQEMYKSMYRFYSGNKAIKPVSSHYAEVARDLKLAINLLDIIADETSIYKDGILYCYINTKNANRFVKYKIPEDKSYKELLLCDLRKQKAFYLYNKLRLYKMETWWD